MLSSCLFLHRHRFAVSFLLTLFLLVLFLNILAVISLSLLLPRLLLWTAVLTLSEFFQQFVIIVCDTEPPVMLPDFRTDTYGAVRELAIE